MQAAADLPTMRSEDATRFTLATVLVVAADTALLDAARAGLEAAGCSNVATATAVERTQALLATHDPDVLLLAARAPAEAAAGLAELGRLRESSQWRHLPVIVLLGNLDSEGKRQALALGASDILATPLDQSELVLRLRNALGYKAYQDRLLKRDPLTGLANRGEFMRRVQAVLLRSELPDPSEDSDAARCLLLLNLDRFKQVNDSIGHQAGDALLISVAQRLSEVVARHGGSNRRAGSKAATPWLARIDSDRFMALLPGAPASPRHESALRDVVDAFRRPFHLNRREFYLGASIGVASYPADGNSAEQLVQRAELAMNQAKKRGGNTVDYFAAEMQTRAAERLTLENHLRYAIRRQELRLYYQPKVDCASLRMVGVEALIRWQHPEHGLIAPQRFVPIAEEAGLIDDIGEWAIREACRQGAAWLQEGLAPLQVAVNLSAAQLLQGAVTAALAQALATTGFPASRLTLELTESMLMTAGEHADRTIAALKGLGVALSLDDFGTGYSPLTYLRQLPIDEIKIDRSFVHGLPAERDSAAITGAIIALAGALGLQVVAEGVETTAELTFLRRFDGCRFQGYLFSKPVPADTLTAMLRSMRDKAGPCTP
jgi:diguanylate cyclase (GGDEF)-like protein